MVKNMGAFDFNGVLRCKSQGGRFTSMSVSALCLIFTCQWVGAENTGGAVSPKTVAAGTGQTASDLLPSSGWSGWPTAHGNPDNSGFVPVLTAPAVTPSAVVDVGPLAAGVNPVAGKDGRVYIGNLKGELVALDPNGSVRWRKLLDPSCSDRFCLPLYGNALVSPLVSKDGSIFVVSGYGYRDHRLGDSIHSANSFLHKFSPSGEKIATVALPEHNLATGASGAPNLWDYNGTEVIMLPVHFGVMGEVHLVAFSTTLTLLDDEKIPAYGDLIGGGLADAPMWEKVVACVLNPLEVIIDIFQNATCAPFVYGGFVAIPEQREDVNSIYRLLASGLGVYGESPDMAIRQHAQGESPRIFAVNGWSDEWGPKYSALSVYTFDPASGFHLADSHYYDDMGITTSPTALASGDAVVGLRSRAERDSGRLSFEPAGTYHWWDTSIYATPTLTPNGRIAAISWKGNLGLVHNTGVERRDQFDGYSFASAASSCTHLYVAVEKELVTVDLITMKWINRMPWADGGQHSTIIGPGGHVYATNEHGIYVFPPVPGRNPTNLTGTQCVP